MTAARATGSTPRCDESHPTRGEAARCNLPDGHVSAHVHYGPRDHITALWEAIDYSHDEDERHPDDDAGDHAEDPYGLDEDIPGFLARYAE